jgi:hypothetical protein
MQKLQQFKTWVKANPFAALLIVILIGLVVKSSWGSYVPMPMSMRSMSYDSAEMMTEGYGAAGAPAALMLRDEVAQSAKMIAPVPPYQPESVDLSASDRRVVKNASISTLVKSVRQSVDELSTKVTQFGGFVVNSYVNQPEEGGTATLSVRVKSDQLEQFLQVIRGQSIRVISENIDGQDITDQFTDSQARLATLEQTLSIFRGMLAQAKTVEEVMDVQDRILQIQSQIDQVKGQLKYLEGTSDSSLVTIYLSTDELSLPYTPGDPWRPQVVFKTAVRSLMMTLRGVANAAIWVAVYSPILIGGLVILWIIKKIIDRRAPSQT